MTYLLASGWLVAAVLFAVVLRLGAVAVSLRGRADHYARELAGRDEQVAEARQLLARGEVADAIDVLGPLEAGRGPVGLWATGPVEAPSAWTPTNRNPVHVDVGRGRS